MRKKEMHYHLMLLPGMIFVLIFNIMPLFGTVIAFQNFIPAKGILHSRWVGLDNFKYMFQLDDSRQIIFNTVYISFMKIVLNLIVPVCTAILINELVFKRFKMRLFYCARPPHLVQPSPDNILPHATRQVGMSAFCENMHLRRYSHRP